MFNKFTIPRLDGTWPEFAISDWSALIVLVAFTILLPLEIRSRGGKRPSRVLRKSYLANIATFLFNDTVMSVLSVSTLLVLAAQHAPSGLLDRMPDPLWKGLLSFILLDLVLYFWHRACHTFDWLWMFHKVHHSDLSMNVSTAFRSHVIEVFLITLVKAAFILATGVDLTLMLANEMLFTIFVLFHHSDLHFRAEAWLGRLITVPALHRVHHSTERREHDRNFGFVFSIWDRMFGTFSERKPVRVGLPQVPAQSFVDLIKFGFTRIYPSPRSVEAMIAEAAYFKAEKRGFAPGRELIDWLEAEKEVRKCIG